MVDDEIRLNAMPDSTNSFPMSPSLVLLHCSATAANPLAMVIPKSPSPRAVSNSINHSFALATSSLIACRQAHTSLTFISKALHLYEEG